MATITGSTGDDVLIGTAGDDTYTAFMGGNDVVWDFGGYDTYIINASFASLIDEVEDPANGSMTLVFTGGSLTFNGASFDGNDFAWGEIESIVLTDLIYKEGRDTDEMLDYGAQGHSVHIFANGGNDTVIGSAFNDELGGGEGNDLIMAGAGDDRLEADANNEDTLDGGAGYDIVEWHGGNVYIGMASGSLMLRSGYYNGNGITFYDQGSTAATNIERVVSYNGIADIGGVNADTLVGADGVYDTGSDWTIQDNDTLLGLDGDDSLTGGAGNDSLVGGTGVDTLDGGIGDDSYDIDDTNDQVIDSAGNDMAWVHASWTLADGIESATVVSTGAAVVLTGNAMSNLLNGDGNANTLNGGAGNDVINAGNGNDVLDGGTGADVMQGGSGMDTYYFDDIGDRISGFDGDNDVIYSSISLDLNMAYIDTGGGNNNDDSRDKAVLTGSANLTLSDRVDMVGGWSPSTHLAGNAGANTITAYDGNDVLDGGAGVDSLVGGLGNDIYYVDNIDDKTKENAAEGSDVVYSSVTWTLAVNTEHLFLSGAGNINGNGNLSANTILGNTGNNNLRGNQGADTLIGGDGNDTLAGGGGADVLSGGAGADRFLFNAAPGGANIDHVQSFTVASDRVQIDHLVFTALVTTGTLAASAFKLGTSAGDADDRIIYDSATGSLYYDADGNGAGFKTKFAIIDDKAAITAADIQIV